MKLKVCGMRDRKNIKDLVALSPDFIGFIFYSRSSRYVSTLDDETLKLIPKSISKVGVFVNEPVLNIRKTARLFNLDFIQLHGCESPSDCTMLRNCGLKVIKAFQVANKEDILASDKYEGVCDFFLFDTKTSGFGGSGKSFNWTLLDEYKGKTPFLLSGGIRPESVQDLWKLNHPMLAGYDINSGFEIAPALKDIESIKSFKSKMAL